MGEQPSGPVWLRIGTQAKLRARIDITKPLSTAAGKGWREMLVTRECARGMGSGIGFESAEAFEIQIAEVKREDLPANTPCSF